MLYASIHGELRQPRAPGERARCRCCGAEVTVRVDPQAPPQWRHAAEDCDPWSEPQGAWHAGWKARFPVECRELPLEDVATRERHRADICCAAGPQRATVVALQHGLLPEREMMRREAFYRRQGRLYWLLHIHDEQSVLRTCMQLSLATEGRRAVSQGSEFTVLRLPGRGLQFIEQWKQSGAYVLLDLGGQLYHLATHRRSQDLLQQLERGEFAVRPVRTDSFVAAVTREMPRG